MSNKITFHDVFLFLKTTAVGFSSGPLERDHLTTAIKSAHRPRRECVTTRGSTETGKRGRGPLPWTEPGAGIERDPCRMSGTDAPALRSESLGRYEQEGTPVFDLDILFRKKEDGELYACWHMCVCRLCMCVHVKNGACTLAEVDGEGTISVVAVKETCKPTFIGLHCEASMKWKQISPFFMASCQFYEVILIYFDRDKG